MKAPNTNSSYPRPFAPALVGAGPGLAAGGRLPRSAPRVPWLEIVAKPEKGPGFKAGSLVAGPRRTRQRTEFWENLTFAALAMSGLVTIAICFAGN